MKRILASIICLFVITGTMDAQKQKKGFEQFRERHRKEFARRKEGQLRKFAEYRRKRNEEYAEFMRSKWGHFEASPLRERPPFEDIPPVVLPVEEVPPVPEPKPIPFEEVVEPPKPQPQPEPIVPIIPLDVDPLPLEPKPIQPVDPVKPDLPDVPLEPVAPIEPVKMEEAARNTVSFTFYGTTVRVRLDKSKLFTLKKITEKAISDVWLKLSKEDYTALIYDCLQTREQRQLCDWAYLMMLKDMSEAVFGPGTNEAELLAAYVYCQSGYKMRLCVINNRVRFLFASSHEIYDLSYFIIENENYYSLDNVSGSAFICTQEFPEEKPLSLFITKEQKFGGEESEGRMHQSTKHPEMVAGAGVGQNLLDFYTAYPTSEFGKNKLTRWAVYANTPLQTPVKEKIYPVLQKHLEGLPPRAAVNKLLNFVQTGFVYEYDDKVWGRDRAFFAEESLHYPYCDCEDRSILFSRLVRDLLKLDVVLVFYPGHLATAVHIPEQEFGDYIPLNGKNYTVCDPTYINAPAGMTMPGMDNATAKVILLK